MPTVVDKAFADFRTAAQLMEQHGELSLRSTLDDLFRKSILMAAASYFEHRVSKSVYQFSQDRAQADTLLPSLIRNRVISRQYHSWFDWDRNNANTFFSMFGDDFKAYMNALLENYESLGGSIRAFIEIGRDRNRLAHQDYASFTLEKTADEIFRLYQVALPFVELIPHALVECSDGIRSRRAQAG